MFVNPLTSVCERRVCPRYLQFCESVNCDPEVGLTRDNFITLYTRRDLIDKVSLHFSVFMAQQDEDGDRDQDADGHFGEIGQSGDLDSMDVDEDLSM